MVYITKVETSFSDLTSTMTISNLEDYTISRANASQHKELLELANGYFGEGIPLPVNFRDPVQVSDSGLMDRSSVGWSI